MAEYSDPVDPREGLADFSGFLGLRNNVAADAFAFGDLVTSLNVDIDDSLGITRRTGHSAVKVAAVDRDLWASGSVCLGVGSNVLKRINPDYSTVTLLSGLTASLPLSYAAVGDRVFWSNGDTTGCVQNGVNRSWGLAVPGPVVLAATGGTLTAGKYQVVVVYLRQDGQESGASMASTIELTAAGGIDCSALPVSADPTVTYKVICVAPVGGETLYRAGVIANADTTFTIREVRMDTSPLMTQFLAPPPAGEHIAYWRGWMLVSSGSRLYPSEPYAPELFDLRKSVPFLDAITMLAPEHSQQGGGVWMGTNSQIIWLTGDSPEAWAYQTAASYGVIPGTLAYGDGELIGDASLAGTMIPFFASKGGLCAGLPGGKLLNLTQSRFAIPIQDVGAAIVRRHRGTAQLLVTMKGAEVAGNVYV